MEGDQEQVQSFRRRRDMGQAAGRGDNFSSSSSLLARLKKYKELKKKKKEKIDRREDCRTGSIRDKE